MIIGIDFDNTIASYDKSFFNIAKKKSLVDSSFVYKNKTHLKNYIYKKNNGKNLWMRLQGLVYGKYIKEAELMPGVISFLIACKIRKYKVYIISHKTEFGHFDKYKIPLRYQALSWMENNSFFKKNYINLNKKNVFFADTQKDKINIISKIKCDWFIDDLEEIFLNKEFPLNTKKILFSKYTKKINRSINVSSNWNNIIDVIIGKLRNQDIKYFINFFFNKKILSLNQISCSGNSRIYRMKAINNKFYAVKCYPNHYIDNRNRLKVEFNSLKFLNKFNFFNLPSAIKMDQNFNIGIYQWINGKKIINPTKNDLQKVINFIKKLYNLSTKITFKDINYASEACLSAEDLVNQIESRIFNLFQIKHKYPKLNYFLINKFIPLWKIIKKMYFNKWPESSRLKPLNNKNLFLSPSDLGFHNILKKDKDIFFLDFEYFGWDDPVKLVADFNWHPSVVLKTNLIDIWNKEISKIFVKDQDFASRLKASLPFYGMRWIMIILNDYIPEFIEKRKIARNLDSYHIQILQNSQLNKGLEYYNTIKYNFTL